MSTDTLLGWSLTQWAIAKARIGDEFPTTIDGALDLMQQWETRYCGELPGSETRSTIQSLDPFHPLRMAADFEWARKLWRVAMDEVFNHKVFPL